FTFNATDVGDEVNVVDGLAVNNAATTEVNSGKSGTFATLDFAYKTFVTVNAGDGLDTVTLNNPTPAAYLVQLTIHAGRSSDRINVASVSVSTEVDGDQGMDTIDVGSGDNTLDHVLADLTVDGGTSFNTLIVEDQKHNQPANWTITSSAVNR